MKGDFKDVATEGASLEPVLSSQGTNRRHSIHLHPNYQSLNLSLSLTMQLQGTIIKGCRAVGLTPLPIPLCDPHGDFYFWINHLKSRDVYSQRKRASNRQHSTIPMKLHIVVSAWWVWVLITRDWQPREKHLHTDRNGWPNHLKEELRDRQFRA